MNRKISKLKREAIKEEVKQEIKEIVEGIETAKGSGWVKLRDVLDIIKNL